MAHKVFIFCDSGRHARKHVPVTTFVRNAGGDWYELMPRHDSRSTMTSLDGEDTPVTRGGDRLRWRFECDKCGPRSVVEVRREKLLAVLEKCYRGGLPHIPIAELGARLAGTEADVP